MIPAINIAVCLKLVSIKINAELPFDICLLISELNVRSRLNVGTSSFARKRRALQLGRCHRCYRVSPKFYFTRKCDGKTCVPGIGYRRDIEILIKGVTSVIPNKSKFECHS
ncbi:nucleic acid binding protein [Cucumber vein-clearing virus]|uniref:RNA silencing suppressor n=1 Tax=Cucumber vein-clearing virus TaxID=1092564 RepID=G5D8W0_9VIRU|nr:nucleic acid binding protein [Cucumber vein-clearing virus]AEP83731.1 nucleic acid binding protein [Cucumber vein-clearing virus]WOL52750.1 nucleic acid binding protein [Cucumber vein-clearing virus]